MKDSQGEISNKKRTDQRGRERYQWLSRVRDAETAIKRQTDANAHAYAYTDGSRQRAEPWEKRERGWPGKGGMKRQTWSQSHQGSPPQKGQGPLGVTAESPTRNSVPGTEQVSSRCLSWKGNVPIADGLVRG